MFITFTVMINTVEIISKAILNIKKNRRFSIQVVYISVNG